MTLNGFTGHASGCDKNAKIADQIAKRAKAKEKREAKKAQHAEKTEDLNKVAN